MRKIGPELLVCVSAFVAPEVRDALRTEAGAGERTVSALIRDILGDWYANWDAIRTQRSWQREEAPHGQVE